jgi:hypothetical protein
MRKLSLILKIKTNSPPTGVCGNCLTEAGGCRTHSTFIYDFFQIQVLFFLSLQKLRLWELSPHLKGTVKREFSFQVFSWISFPHVPLSFPLGPFRILSKIHGCICKSMCTTGINDTSGTCGKFAAGVVDAGGAPWLGMTWGNMTHGKNLKQKISWHCPFKIMLWFGLALPKADEKQVHTVVLNS